MCLDYYYKMSSDAVQQSRLGGALVNFSCDGIFPDSEDVVSAYVQDDELPATLDLLKKARSELEVSTDFH